MATCDGLSRLLATRLIALRRHAGMSQAQLARAAGISRSAINAAESGQSQITIRTIRALALTLGVEFGALFAPEAPGICRICRNADCVLRRGEVTDKRQSTAEIFSLALEADAAKLRRRALSRIPPANRGGLPLTRVTPPS